MTTPPLDLAAQAAMITFTLQEVVNSRPAELVVRRSLELGGIKDINPLLDRKSQGLSVYEQIPSYPQGSAKDITELLQQIQTVIDSLNTEIAIPYGVPIAPGPGYQPVTTTAANVAIASTKYSAPLGG